MAREIPKPNPSRNAGPPTRDQIAQRAYEIFVERGRPEGRDQEHWFEAEAQLSAPIQQQAKTPTVAPKATPSARR
jgi:hypothetical protein